MRRGSILSVITIGVAVFVFAGCSSGSSGRTPGLAKTSVVGNYDEFKILTNKYFAMIELGPVSDQTWAAFLSAAAYVHSSDGMSLQSSFSDAVGTANQAMESGLAKKNSAPSMKISSVFTGSIFQLLSACRILQWVADFPAGPDNKLLLADAAFILSDISPPLSARSISERNAKVHGSFERDADACKAMQPAWTELQCNEWAADAIQSGWISFAAMSHEPRRNTIPLRSFKEMMMDMRRSEFHDMYTSENFQLCMDLVKLFLERPGTSVADRNAQGVELFQQISRKLITGPSGVRMTAGRTSVLSPDEGFVDSSALVKHE